MPTSKTQANLLLENQLCFSLYSASNAISRVYRPLLKELDLTYLQYIVMMVLWQYNTMNVKDLGIKIHLDSGTLTPLLKRLELKGLIDRIRSKDDERMVNISLTIAGAALKQRAQSVPSTMLCKSKMSIEELTRLKQGCDLLLTKLKNE